MQLLRHFILTHVEAQVHLTKLFFTVVSGALVSELLKPHTLGVLLHLLPLPLGSKCAAPNQD